MPSFDLLVHGRGNPEGVGHLLGTARAYASQPSNVEVIVAVEDDDDQVRAYQEVGARVVRGDLNACLPLTSADFVFRADDNTRFATERWDTLVTKVFHRFQDRIALVYGNTGHPDAPEFAVAPFLSREWVKAVGYLEPPYQWWDQVATALGRAVYVSEVITWQREHPSLTERDQYNPQKSADLVKLREAMVRCNCG